jgi:hypothetical protein
MVTLILLVTICTADAALILRVKPPHSKTTANRGIGRAASPVLLSNQTAREHEYGLTSNTVGSAEQLHLSY